MTRQPYSETSHYTMIRPLAFKTVQHPTARLLPSQPCSDTRGARSGEGMIEPFLPRGLAHGRSKLNPCAPSRKYVPAARADFEECESYFVQEYPALSDRTRSVVTLMFSMLVRPFITRPLNVLNHIVHRRVVALGPGLRPSRDRQPRKTNGEQWLCKFCRTKRSLRFFRLARA